MENQTKKIHEALLAIMTGIDPIAKDKQNVQQGYKFRGVEAVYGVLNPMLIANKVLLIPECIEHHIEQFASKSGGALFRAIVKMKYTLLSTEDGSSIECTMMGEGMDSGDKATPKAVSIAFKYLCFQLFCIPVEGADDPDKDSHNVAPKTIQPNQNANQQASQPAKQEPEKWLNETVKDGSYTREWAALMTAIAEGRVTSVSEVRQNFKVSKEIAIKIENLLNQAA